MFLNLCFAFLLWFQRHFEIVFQSISARLAQNQEKKNDRRENISQLMRGRIGRSIKQIRRTPGH